MAQIKNIDGLTIDQVRDLVDQGGKFVIFQYAISILVMTFRQSSDVYFIKPDESAVSKHIGFTILTLVMGWWGFPWGPIYSIGALVTNFSGGKDVTHEIMDQIAANYGNRVPGATNPANPYNLPNTNTGNSGSTSGNSGYNLPNQNNNSNSSGSNNYNIPT
jgi:hypothetical protein